MKANNGANLQNMSKVKGFKKCRTGFDQINQQELQNEVKFWVQIFAKKPKGHLKKYEGHLLIDKCIKKSHGDWQPGASKIFIKTPTDSINTQTSM